MFNNIIYFIVVLLIFNISYPDKTTEYSLGYSLLMLLLTWLIFTGYCRWGFWRLQDRFKGNRTEDGSLSGAYHNLILRLSILAIFLFALAVFMFHLKYWLLIIPGVKSFSVLQSIIALMLFIFYLGTIWYFAYPVYILAFCGRITRRSFIISNFKFNLPILFPYIILSFVYDLISITPWLGIERLLGRPEGQMAFFTIFLSVLMIFMPRFIKYWWGCKPFEPSERVRELKAFLHEMRFRYRDLLKWPIFEGRMMTAGIMGIVPRYRYILVTDSLMEILSIEELKAVLAHEMGHAKYRHLLFFILFFLGYMVLSFGLFNPEFYFVLGAYAFDKFGIDNSNPNYFYIALAIPILITMIIYFRYVMGFFMRHFERQADLYSAVTMGNPRLTVSSLEKIALLSGKSRDHPSWHHFSIKERVDYLWRILKEPDLVRWHNRLVIFSFAGYLIIIIVLGYALNFSPLRQNLSYNLIGKVLNKQLVLEPDNILLNQNLAMVYQKMGRYGEAIKIYERIILLDRAQAVALNNLAWLLVTVAEEEIRDPERALILAKSAVSLDKSPIFIDTLAEAYYANGFIPEAVETIKVAIQLATENRGYYKKQLEKFLTQRESL